MRQSKTTRQGLRRPGPTLAVCVLIALCCGCALPGLATTKTTAEAGRSPGAPEDADSSAAGQSAQTQPDPALHDASIARTQAEPEPAATADPFFFRRIGEWMQEDDPDGSGNGEDYENRLKPRSDSAVDIRRPGPDTSNFPNSPFTLPQGRMYIETSPGTFYGPSRVSSRLYNWEFLLRYGLTDRLELRMFSNGYTVQGAPSATTGFSPLAFDLKAHLWDEHRKFFIPAAGLEVYMETNLGSPAFNQGTQPSINLLFAHSLPAKFQFEWNIGVAGNQTVGRNPDIFYSLALQWALQRQVTDDLTIFWHGFLNNAALPRFGQAIRNTAADIVVTGVGSQYYLSTRLALFGSFNFGLTADSPKTVAYLGFAYAF